jgi:3-hydroxybutyryl-CoA dehydrogenase
VRDSPGFVANRLQFALFREAALMLEEGIADARQIDEIVTSTFGFRLSLYGPFAIADMAGLDVYAGAYETLRAAYGDRLAAPPRLIELVSSGRLGVKQDGGFLNLEGEEARGMIEGRDRAYATLLKLVRPAPGA